MMKLYWRSKRLTANITGSKGEDAMGRFLNIGNKNFAEFSKTQYFVDKSRLINKLIKKDITEKFVCNSRARRFGKSLESIYNQTGERFVIIFDEWDYPIRELDESSPDRLAYTEMLRGLFKNNAAKSYVRLAYLTGIMPIVRIKGQSAVNNFMEYTMTNPMDLAQDIGFTEEEVFSLCKRFNVDFEQMKEWYNGYDLNGTAMYNPLSVVRAISAKRFGQYWTVTGTYGALIHLGYFAYDADAREAYVPNKEIQEVFYQYMENNESDNLSRFIRVSEKILNAVMERDAEETARQIQNVHNDFISGIEYNDENSLVCTITIALISAFRYYHKPIREFPCGRGFADIVYLPLQTQPNRPVLVVELKWNKSAQTAIAQIKKKQYPESLREYSGDILLVGIDYDKKTKEHYCVIESLGL